jgi:hypothetical protein
MTDSAPPGTPAATARLASDAQRAACKPSGSGIRGPKLGWRGKRWLSPGQAPGAGIRPALLRAGGG